MPRVDSRSSVASFVEHVFTYGVAPWNMIFWMTFIVRFNFEKGFNKMLFYRRLSVFALRIKYHSITECHKEILDFQYNLFYVRCIDEIFFVYKKCYQANVFVLQIMEVYTSCLLFARRLKCSAYLLGNLPCEFGIFASLFYHILYITVSARNLILKRHFVWKLLSSLDLLLLLGNSFKKSSCTNNGGTDFENQKKKQWGIYVTDCNQFLSETGEFI